jgi:hypothetical protein
MAGAFGFSFSVNAGTVTYQLRSGLNREGNKIQREKCQNQSRERERKAGVVIDV